MPLVCLGISHHTAPIEVRERHAVPTARIAEALFALHDYEAVREAVIVSTCNRMEIYAELDDYEVGVEQLKQFIQNFRHSSVSDIKSYLYTLLGLSAVEHLFRVTTGLDSKLVGEAEIMGQVKAAYISAQSAGTVGVNLHELFRSALHAGKRARSRTRIGSASISVSTAAVDIAMKYLGVLEGARALVIGAGKMGQLAARRLHEHAAGEIVVANRNLIRAQEAVRHIGAGRAIPFDAIAGTLQEVDLVITAVGAETFLLTPELVAAAAPEKRSKPLVLIDIAVPRDVDPDVGLLPGVQLVDIDALRDVVEDRLERRRKAIPHVEVLIAEQVDRFATWYRGRSAIPAISALAQQAEHIRLEEVHRLLARCPTLSEREKHLIVGTSRRILSRLLHAPFAQIRTQSTTDLPSALELGKALTTLFTLDSPTSTPTLRVEDRFVVPKPTVRHEA